VSTSAAVSATLAGRRTDLQGSITNTARTLEAIAAQRTALQDALSRAPAFLREAGRTLENSSQTFRSVKPVLRELRPAAAPLAAVLRQLPGVGRAARPAVGQLRNLLPALRAALLAVPSLDRAARPALVSTTSALASALPIAAGLRPYAPDVIAGLFNGFTGTTGGYYDANGHYARIQLVTGVAALSGTLSPLAAGQLQTGLSARCPGAAVEPADDKTNPNPEDPSVCDTGQNKK
jgi:ABC-type transporter Mla subunit MlaD